MKEAVVFLLDAHPSMNAPYPSNDTNVTGSTRLSCAKEALEGIISQLMIQSVTNEVGVIVLNSYPIKSEEGYMDDDMNPYLMELTMPCVTRPNVELLRAIRRVECSKSNYSGADVCEGMVVAEEALRQRTYKKKYARRLVVFTDAAHKVESSNDVILRVIDKLRDLGCTLTVIGVDFQNSATFEEPLSEDKKAAVKTEEKEAKEDEDMADSDGNESGGDDDDEQEDNDEDDEDIEAIKEQNEKLLISVARLTGGSVIAASTMKEIADATLGKRIPKSTKKKIQFHIAPELTLDARFSLLLSQSSFPSLRSQAVLLDENKNEMVDGNGEVMAHPVKKFTDHFDADNREVEVDESNRTHGYRYGSDCIPMSSIDKKGLQLTQSDPSISIIGYCDQSKIPRPFFVGPPYAVFGHDSHQVCCAIAALAHGLNRTKKAAICTVYKTRCAEPLLGALFPLQEEGKSKPSHLFFIQLPFADDKRPFNLTSLKPAAEGSAESRACDDMIDALMLPPDAIRSEEIPNPAIRSFHKTVKARAVDPWFTEIVTAREHHSVDSMATPADVLERASSALETFCTTFPRKEVSEEEAKAKKKKKYWTENDD